MGAAELFDLPATPSSPSRNAASDPTLTVIAAGDPGRAAAEDLVRACFLEAYGARVSYFLPNLLALSQPGRGPCAVLGYRQAAMSPLFLEHYLDAPVERNIARATGHSVARTAVTEVGNLAVAFPGGARCLVVALTAFLAAQGRGWVAFTAGTALRNTFRRLGVALIPLAEARPERLPGGGAEWGHYYDDAPLVVGACVPQGVAAIRERLSADHAGLAALWSQGQALQPAVEPGGRR